MKRRFLVTLVLLAVVFVAGLLAYPRAVTGHGHAEFAISITGTTPMAIARTRYLQLWRPEELTRCETLGDEDLWSDALSPASISERTIVILVCVNHPEGGDGARIQPHGLLLLVPMADGTLVRRVCDLPDLREVASCTIEL